MYMFCTFTTLFKHYKVPFGAVFETRKSLIYVYIYINVYMYVLGGIRRRKSEWDGAPFPSSRPPILIAVARGVNGHSIGMRFPSSATPDPPLDPVRPHTLSFLQTTYYPYHCRSIVKQRHRMRCASRHPTPSSLLDSLSFSSAYTS